MLKQILNYWLPPLVAVLVLIYVWTRRSRFRGWPALRIFQRVGSVAAVMYAGMLIVRFLEVGKADFFNTQVLPGLLFFGVLWIFVSGFWWLISKITTSL